MIVLSPTDLALASVLVVVDAGISVGLRLNLHRQLLWAAGRMVAQLIAVGFILRFIFSLNNPLATLVIVLIMGAIAAREIAARPARKFRGLDGLAISGATVALATLVTAGLALITAIRPQPWYDPRYAVSLVGIILGSVLEGIPAIVLFGPLLFPIAKAAHVNEVHYAMVVILAMGVGLFAPPLGVGYYAACAIGQVSPDSGMKRIWPYLGALVVGLIAVAAIPWLSTGFL